MPQDYYAGSSINAQVLELYTDTRKVQSIIFPVTGYRDFDSFAWVINYPKPDQNYNGEGYVWFNETKDNINSYHFKFHRDDITGASWKERGSSPLIAPYEAFYNTDGFGVRPVRIHVK